MSEIKLPVTVKGFVIYDSDHKQLSLKQIVAALNAAPKLAFAELTAEGVGLILQNVLLEIGDPPEDRIERATWVKRHDATVLAHLQAFAAPVAPAWQPIETAPMKGSVRILLFSPHAPGVCLGFWADNPDAEWLADCDGMEGASWPKDAFTHWMPLPAAPETQGGREDA